MEWDPQTSTVLFSFSADRPIRNTLMPPFTWSGKAQRLANPCKICWEAKNSKTELSRSSKFLANAFIDNRSLKYLKFDVFILAIGARSKNGAILA